MTCCGCLPSPLPCFSGKFEVIQPTSSPGNTTRNAKVVDSAGPAAAAADADDTSSTKSEDAAMILPVVDNTAESMKGECLEPLSGLSPMVESTVVPLNDDPSRAVSQTQVTLTPRQNPKMRLLTSSSTISDEVELNSENSEHSDWSMTNLTDGKGPAEVFDVGLMITIEDGHCQFHLVPDANYAEIHPNVYAPANISNMKVLYGGGSGVAVFGGHHPQLGDIVMKHGGYKDMQELFALATISEELLRRGKHLGHTIDAQNMQERLPSFKMIHMSPHHIMDRGKELVGVLRNFIRSWSLTSVPSTSSIPSRNSRMRRASQLSREKQPQLDVGMKIRIFEGEEQDKLSFLLDTKSAEQSLSLILPTGSVDFQSNNCIQVIGNAYDALKSVVQGLTPIMTERMFKFTLAQKTIGGVHPKTGNQWLYEGKLSGTVLKNLMDQMIRVIRDLRRLTLPEEVDVVEEIRDEVLRFERDEQNLRADHISETADAFVGSAIKKNFHPEKGRQRFLREMSAQLREGSLFLTPEEEVPAQHLALLLRSGALMSDSFLNSPMEPTVLQPHAHFWRNILRRAVDSRSSMSPTALKRIWTCGLTDAGIHNLFVNETELYLFDLGEPQLMSLPGFLTKFLFSFFHTLGMEEDGKGSWVRRFIVVEDKLALTKETRTLLPKAYEAFQECLDRTIAELLDGDRHMRWLLLEYVTLQLMSDTAFCLQKWRVKGGGKKRDGNHQINHEKWLWRALWDIYVAFDINTADSWYRLGVEHPHFRDSLRPSTMESFSNSLSEGLMASMRMSDQLEENILDEAGEQLEEDDCDEPPPEARFGRL